MSRSKSATRPRYANEGFWGRLYYFTARALSNIRQNPFVNIVAIGTIALALLIIALFLLVGANLEGAAENWSKRVQVTVYFDKELSLQEISGFKNRIQALDGTDRVQYVSRDEAARRFRARLKGQESLLEGVSADILPSSFEIGLKSDFRNGDNIELYVARLKKVPGIGEIQYGEEWVKRFSAFLTFLRLVGSLLGGFLVLAVIFIISNTIRLTVYARKDEIELQSLVGATRFFIKAPFLIEGVIQGGIGALLAILLLTGCYYEFLYNAGNFLSFNPADAGLSFLPVSYLAGIFIGGVLLGFFGSLTSLRRFINI